MSTNHVVHYDLPMYAHLVGNWPRPLYRTRDDGRPIRTMEKDRRTGTSFIMKDSPRRLGLRHASLLAYLLRTVSSENETSIAVHHVYCRCRIPVVSMTEENVLLADNMAFRWYSVSVMHENGCKVTSLKCTHLSQKRLRRVRKFL